MANVKIIKLSDLKKYDIWAAEFHINIDDEIKEKYYTMSEIEARQLFEEQYKNPYLDAGGTIGSFNGMIEKISEITSNARTSYYRATLAIIEQGLINANLTWTEIIEHMIAHKKFQKIFDNALDNALGTKKQ